MSKRLTLAELLGNKQVTGKDVTGNEAMKPSNDPARWQNPVRYANYDSFNPDMESLYGRDNEMDFSPQVDENGELDPLDDEVEQSQFINSQIEPTEELPSTRNPNRFVAH